MRRSARQMTTWAAAFGILTLAGCDQFQADPVVFTQVGHEVIVRVCLDLTITSIEVEVADDDPERGQIAECGGGDETSGRS